MQGTTSGQSIQATPSSSPPFPYRGEALPSLSLSEVGPNQPFTAHPHHHRHHGSIPRCDVVADIGWLAVAVPVMESYFGRRHVFYLLLLVLGRTLAAHVLGWKRFQNSVSSSSVSVSVCNYIPPVEGSRSGDGGGEQSGRDDGNHGGDRAKHLDIGHGMEELAKKK